MKRRPTVAALLLAAAPWGSGCGPAKGTTAEKPIPAASVAKPAKEDDLGTVVLTPDAEKRLGVAVATAETKPVSRSRTYAGDVVVPPGRLIVVSSPYPATIAAGGDGVMPGQSVKRGQPILAIQPILSAEARAQLTTQKIDADGLVQQARKQFDAARMALDRIEGLRKGVSIGSGAVEDERNRFSLAETNLKNAEARRDTLARTIQESGAGSLAPIPLTAPVDGVLRNAQATPGQQVAAGAILFEVERLDPVWVRVPVYVGDLRTVAADQDARVGTLADGPEDSSTPARPVLAPPSGDPLASTVDLFYELPNPKATFRPGQRLGVSVPLTGSSEALTIPASALYYDIQGGSWAYEQIKERTYVRRRVEVEQVSGNSAVIARGLKPGAKVVTTAVAELYGTEFGFAK